MRVYDGALWLVGCVLLGAAVGLAFQGIPDLAITTVVTALGALYCGRRYWR